MLRALNVFAHSGRSIPDGSSHLQGDSYLPLNHFTGAAHPARPMSLVLLSLKEGRNDNGNPGIN
jgi:hypothetical protein